VSILNFPHLVIRTTDTPVSRSQGCGWLSQWFSVSLTSVCCVLHSSLLHGTTRLLSKCIGSCTEATLSGFILLDSIVQIHESWRWLVISAFDWMTAGTGAPGRCLNSSVASGRQQSGFGCGSPQCLPSSQVEALLYLSTYAQPRKFFEMRLLTQRTFGSVECIALDDPNTPF